MKGMSVGVKSKYIIEDTRRRSEALHAYIKKEKYIRRVIFERTLSLYNINHLIYIILYVINDNHMNILGFDLVGYIEQLVHHLLLFVMMSMLYYLCC